MSDSALDEGPVDSSDSALTARVPVPQSGVYFGAKEYRIDALEKQLGHSVAAHTFVVPWTSPFPAKEMQRDRAEGRVTMIGWLGADLDAIDRGTFDKNIRSHAAFVRELGYPIWIRWAHEMNGGWYVWGKQPAKYIQAFRHIHDLFDAEGAKNVSWVWAPSSGAASSGGGEDAEYAPYYPGDAYVDWIGVDGYNWGEIPGKRWTEWKSLEDVFGEFYRQFAARGKPMMFAEVGCNERGGSKAAWLAAARQTMKSRFPLVKAWMHQNYADMGADWRVNSSPAALTAFRALVQDPYFESRAPR